MKAFCMSHEARLSADLSHTCSPFLPGRPERPWIPLSPWTCAQSFSSFYPAHMKWLILVWVRLSKLNFISLPPKVSISLSYFLTFSPLGPSDPHTPLGPRSPWKHKKTVVNNRNTHKEACDSPSGKIQQTSSSILMNCPFICHSDWITAHMNEHLNCVNKKKTPSATTSQ